MNTGEFRNDGNIFDVAYDYRCSNAPFSKFYEAYNFTLYPTYTRSRGLITNQVDEELT